MSEPLERRQRATFSSHPGLKKNDPPNEPEHSEVGRRPRAQTSLGGLPGLKKSDPLTLSEPEQGAHQQRAATTIMGSGGRSMSSDDDDGDPEHKNNGPGIKELEDKVNSLAATLKKREEKIEALEHRLMVTEGKLAGADLGNLKDQLMAEIYKEVNARERQEHNLKQDLEGVRAELMRAVKEMNTKMDVHDNRIAARVEEMHKLSEAVQKQAESARMEMLAAASGMTVSIGPTGSRGKGDRRQGVLVAANTEDDHAMETDHDDGAEYLRTPRRNSDGVIPALALNRVPNGLLNPSHTEKPAKKPARPTVANLNLVQIDEGTAVDDIEPEPKIKASKASLDALDVSSPTSAAVKKPRRRHTFLQPSAMSEDQAEILLNKYEVATQLGALEVLSNRISDGEAMLDRMLTAGLNRGEHGNMLVNNSEDIESRLRELELFRDKSVSLRQVMGRLSSTGEAVETLCRALSLDVPTSSKYALSGSLKEDNEDLIVYKLGQRLDDLESSLSDALKGLVVKQNVLKQIDTLTSAQQELQQKVARLAHQLSESTAIIMRTSAKVETQTVTTLSVSDKVGNIDSELKRLVKQEPLTGNRFAKLEESCMSKVSREEFHKLRNFIEASFVREASGVLEERLGYRMITKKCLSCDRETTVDDGSGVGLMSSSSVSALYEKERTKSNPRPLTPGERTPKVGRSGVSLWPSPGANLQFGLAPAGTELRPQTALKTKTKTPKERQHPPRPRSAAGKRSASPLYIGQNTPGPWGAEESIGTIPTAVGRGIPTS